MTPENFAYWLNGFVELNAGQPPSPEQWKSICEHLKLTMHKVTPPVGPGLPRHPAIPTTIPGYPPGTVLPSFPGPGLPAIFGPICHASGGVAQADARTLITC